MSGGSMNYLYSRIEMDATFAENTPERRAFSRHLKLVAKALHDIEWVDSSDYSHGDENQAIRACLSYEFILETTIADAQVMLEQLRSEIENAKQVKK